MAKNKGGRPLKFKTVEELQEKIEAYFNSCWTQKLDMFGNKLYAKEKGSKKGKKQPVMVHFKPYTISGLAVVLDCDRQTILNYEKDMRFFGTIHKARQVCQSYAEESLFIGKNPSGAIFNLKNNYDWKDKTEVEHKGSKIIILD